MSKIAVGIPCYHSLSHLIYPLSSLISQVNAKDITLFLAFDNDETAEKTFDIIFLQYKQYLNNIIPLYGDKTLGPGGNRNRILKVVYEETYGQFDYIAFMDHDDSLWNVITLNTLIAPLDEDGSLVATNGVLYEQKEDGFTEIGNNHQTWIHGKLFRISFLKKWDIWFPETTNEDLGFSNLVTQYSDNHQAYIGDITYLWRNNNFSLTRSNSGYLHESWLGFIETKLICYEEIRVKLNEDKAREFLLASLPHIYYLSASFDEYVMPEFRPKAEFLIARYVNSCRAESAYNGTDGTFWQTMSTINLESQEARGLAFNNTPKLLYQDWIHYYTNYKPFLEAIKLDV